MNPFKPDGDDVFVQVPQETHGSKPGAKRVLHRARHVGGDADRLELELEGALGLASEQDVFLYYEQRRKFMQQPARVLEVGERGRLYVETTADAIAAESRESYRVSTLVEDIGVRLGSEGECEVLDVSQTGIAVLASTTYAPGSKVDVELRFEGERHAGVVVVQSVHVPPSGPTRYGLRVIAGELIDALPRVAMAVQRNQLRRRAGN